MARIIKVEMVVYYDDGESFTLMETKPGPGGDNPRFMGQQFFWGMKILMARGLMIISVKAPNQILPDNFP